MLIENQKIVVKWNPNNINHYKQFGYQFTKFGDNFEVFVKEMPVNSKIKVRAVCDNCGVEFEVMLINYYRSMRDSGSCVCINCRSNKTQSKLKEKYGVISPSQTPGSREKARATCLEKYGADNPLKVPQIKEKAVQTLRKNYNVEHPGFSPIIQQRKIETNLRKYGCKNPMQNEEIKIKNKDTLLEKYGVDNAAKIPDAVEKMKETNKIRYGGESSQCSPKVRQKSWDSLFKQGKAPISKVETEFIEIVKQACPNYKCVQQFLYDRMSLDCLLEFNNIKIDVEYDGWYWHKDKQKEDKRRNYFLIRRGFKVYRYISNGALPTVEDVKKHIQYLVEENHSILIVKANDIQEEDII